jgi:hypothetical protein
MQSICSSKPWSFPKTKKNYKQFHTKIADNRKVELKNIISIVDDISKKEIARTKQMFDDHLEFFNMTEEEPEVTLVNDDTFFEKN